MVGRAKIWERAGDGEEAVVGWAEAWGSSPLTDAMDAAKEVSERLQGRVRARTRAPIRRAFIERVSADDPVPPLAAMLRGGRGGAVRVKLELSILWVAAAAPHEVVAPARAWAVLLGLSDPEGRGARRVQDALRWLEENKFVDIVAKPGQPNVIRLRSETGDDSVYELPGAAYNRLRGDRDAAAVHRYIQIPDQLWRQGWIATLSGAAVAMLLVLYAELGRNKPAETDLWFSPSQAAAQYALSEDTRTKGLRELQSTGLVSVRRQSITPDTFDFRRLRNVYRLHPDRADTPPTAPGPVPKPVAFDAPASRNPVS